MSFRARKRRRREGRGHRKKYRPRAVISKYPVSPLFLRRGVSFKEPLIPRKIPTHPVERGGVVEENLRTVKNKK